MIIKSAAFALALAAIAAIQLVLGATSTGEVVIPGLDVERLEAGSDADVVGAEQDSTEEIGLAASSPDPSDADASSRVLEELKACTLHVSLSGSDENSGDAETAPLRSPMTAVDRSGPGDVVCFAPGVYTSTVSKIGALHIQDKNGTPTDPIIFRSLDLENLAVFSMGGIQNGPSISIVFLQRSSYIIIDSIEVTDGFRGVTGNGVHNIQLINSYVHHVGGELVFFGKRAGRIQPDLGNNPSSYEIVIAGNELAFSATLEDGRGFGEGIYIATSDPVYQDDTHNITIQSNRIHDTRGEAIDVKTGGYAVSITDNDIYNIALDSQGAITLAISGTSWNAGEYVVRGNRISNVSRLGSEAVGIWIGHGDALVEDNVIWDVSNWGIYIPNTFNLPGSRDVTLRNNVVWDTGQQSVEWGRDWYLISSNPANVDFNLTNKTWDGVGSSTKVFSCSECVR